MSHGADDDAQAQQDATKIQILMRLDNVDVNANPKLKALVLRHLGRIKGTAAYLDTVERFKVRGVDEDLLTLAVNHPDDAMGVRAAKLLLDFEADAAVTKAVNDRDDAKAVAALTALGNTKSKDAVPFVEPVVLAEDRSVSVRNAAAAALGRTIAGQKALLAMVTAKKLPDDLTFTTANALLASPDPAVRNEAGKHLSLPSVGGGKPLPPIAELVGRRGDAAAGRKVFISTTAKCNTCHRVAGEGKEVGPDLTEIGDKLSREAFYVAVLNPSAGISHNYESHLVATDDGEQRVGIIISETDDTLTLKTPDALVSTIKKSAVLDRRKLKLSLMPSDLQRGMTEQQLVDLIEYLTTLKKAK